MLIETKPWSIGTEVELSSDAFIGNHPATVIRVVDGLMQLSLRDETSLPPLCAGTAISVRQTVTSGLVEADTVVSQGFQGTGKHLMVKEPNCVEKVQRRSLFRTPTALPMTVQIKRAERGDWVSRRVYHHLTTDASGSGCSIETELPLKRGDRLRVTVWPDRPNAVIAGAIVVWTGPSDWPGLKRVGLSFANISIHSQDRLVGTLLEEERVRNRVFMEG